jgi:hypothetical protein
MSVLVMAYLKLLHIHVSSSDSILQATANTNVSTYDAILKATAHTNVSSGDGIVMYIQNVHLKLYLYF